MVTGRFTIGPFNADGTPVEAQVYVMDGETDKETACDSLSDLLAAIEEDRS